MPAPTTPISSPIPNGSLVILPETISPLSVSNIDGTHTNLIRTTFPLLLPSTPPVPELSISPFFWVFYAFFLSLNTHSNRSNFIRKWNFPFYKYFTGIAKSGVSFLLQNNMRVLFSPSGGDGNIDPFFEILDRIPNEEDFIPEFGENNWLDIPENARSIEMDFTPLHLNNSQNLLQLQDIREVVAAVRTPIIFNKIVYLTGFLDDSTTTPDEHGTKSISIMNVVQFLPSTKLIRTNNFPTVAGGRVNTNFYLAFAEAMRFAIEGDVILVNQSISAKNGTGIHEVPLIFDRLIWDLIRFLSDNGITVVLSAGNSSTNLNSVATGVFAFASDDSGAIVVGQSPINGGSTGNLIDVRCENLPTGLRPNDLGESSAASAIVAGMVKNIQTYAKSQRRYLRPFEVKNILKSLDQPLKVTESPWVLSSTIQSSINAII